MLRPGTGESSGRPAKCASRLPKARSAIAWRVCHVALPTCGVSTTLSRARSASGTFGLVLEHVEAGAGDRAALQRFDQRRFVDDRAARDVDQVAVLAERAQHLRVDELARAGAAGRDDDEEIDLGRQRRRARQVAKAAARPFAARGVGDRMSNASARLAIARPIRPRPTMPSRAPLDLARQRHRAARPLAVAHVAIGLRDAARDGEDQGEREVGDLVVEHARACA